MEANIFVASRVFKRDVLRILLSEFHAPLEKHSLGIKESFCISPVFIEMLSTEHD